MVRTAVRVARFGAMLRRARTPALARASRVTIIVYCYITATAICADLVGYGQPSFPA